MILYMLTSSHLHNLKRKREKEEELSSKSSNIDEKTNKNWSGLYNSENDVYSVDNHIYFKGDVNRNNVYKLQEEIQNITNHYSESKNSSPGLNISPKPIYLHLNTYGGYLDAGWVAVDFIRNSTIPIYTIVEGRCASAGTLMSIVGKKRYMTRSSRMLIHQLSGGMWGKMNELEDSYKDCKDEMKDIVSLYVKYTNMKAFDIKEYLKKDRWWNMSKCKSRGLVDEEWKNSI